MSDWTTTTRERKNSNSKRIRPARIRKPAPRSVSEHAAYSGEKSKGGKK